MSSETACAAQTLYLLEKIDTGDISAVIKHIKQETAAGPGGQDDLVLPTMLAYGAHARTITPFEPAKILAPDGRSYALDRLRAIGPSLSEEDLQADLDAIFGDLQKTARLRQTYAAEHKAQFSLEYREGNKEDLATVAQGAVVYAYDSAVAMYLLILAGRGGSVRVYTPEYGETVTAEVGHVLSTISPYFTIFSAN